MPPRSILKGQASQQPASYLPSHTGNVGRVHFPPTPQLSSTYYAYPAGYYDRSSIVVAPNDCALPRRHCPERTYVLSGGRGEARLLKQVEASQQADDEDAGDTTPTATYGQRADYFSLPFPSSSSSHLPDLTWSESEDSDGVISPATDALEPRYQAFSMPTNSPRSRKSTGLLPPSSSSSELSQDALSFLPHAPPHQRRRSVSPKNRERKERRTYSSSDSDAPVPIPSSSPRSRRYVSTFTPTSTTNNFGCLDGF